MWHLLLQVVFFFLIVVNIVTIMVFMFMLLVYKERHDLYHHQNDKNLLPLPLYVLSTYEKFFSSIGNCVPCWDKWLPIVSSLPHFILLFCSLYHTWLYLGLAPGSVLSNTGGVQGNHM